MDKDYYEILGVKRDSTEKEIKKAYRELCKIHHPDKGGDAEEFKKISRAYETLSDKDKRSHYDRFGTDEPVNRNNRHDPFSGGMSVEDIINEFGGGRYRNTRQKRVGRDIRFNMTISLEDVFNGISKKFKYKRDVACVPCNGQGGRGKETCQSCGGSGWVISQIQTPIGIMNTQSTCQTCAGEGYVIKDACSSCKGAGIEYKEDIIEINIPKGISENEVLQYMGMGNAIRDGIPGSLLVRIVISNHKDFVRNGNDLRYLLKLNYHQLVLGDKVEIPTIDGNNIAIDVPKHSKIGDNLRISGKGLPILNTNNRGNLIITLDIKMPENIGDEEMELIKKIKNLYENVASDNN